MNIPLVPFERSCGRSRAAAGRMMTAAVLALTFCNQFALADWTFDGAAGFEFEDNLSRARLSADRQADGAFTTDLRLGQYVQLDDRSAAMAN
ncbi:MAG: hypothetical protein ACREXT_04625, partial [Gammaproteobacteria bacterium]